MQGGVAIRLGVGSVRLGLLFFALGYAVVLDEILVHVGHPAESLGGGERLAISADG